MAESWKAVERRIAHTLGVQRTPLSGENSRHTSSDTLHPHLFVEVKSQDSITYFEDLVDLKADARRRDKRPLIVLEEDDDDGERLVLSYFEDALEVTEHPYRTLEDYAEDFLLQHEVTGRSLRIFSLWEETVPLARNEGKTPILALKENNRSGAMAVTSWEWWERTWDWDSEAIEVKA